MATAFVQLDLEGLLCNKVWQSSSWPGLVQTVLHMTIAHSTPYPPSSITCKGAILTHDLMSPFLSMTLTTSLHSPCKHQRNAPKTCQASSTWLVEATG